MARAFAAGAGAAFAAFAGFAVTVYVVAVVGRRVVRGFDTKIGSSLRGAFTPTGIL